MASQSRRVPPTEDPQLLAIALLCRLLQEDEALLLELAERVKQPANERRP